MSTHTPIVEYLATSRLGEKGQLTVPKQFRDDLGLGVGDPMAVLRIGDGLILIPELPQLQRLCNSIAEVLASAGATASDIQATLPRARDRVFRRHYPHLAHASPKVVRRHKKQA